MSHRFKHARAQFNTGPDTRPTGPGGVRSDDPKRPGGAYNGGPRQGSHDTNNRPPTKRSPRGRG